MSFELSEEVGAIRDMAAKFAQKEILPRVAEDEKRHEFQRDLVRKMGELGFYGCPIPEEYGGSGLGFLAHAVVTEEIARVSGSLRAAFNMQTMGTAREIYQYGNEAQKRKYIPRLLSGEFLGCIGITEPNAGSDVGAIRTKALRKEKTYILNGSKNWITYAQVADGGIIYAYTNPAVKYKGISAFIVEMKWPGIKTGPTAEKLGWHACPTGRYFLKMFRSPRKTCSVKREGGLSMSWEAWTIPASLRRPGLSAYVRA